MVTELNFDRLKNGSIPTDRNMDGQKYRTRLMAGSEWQTFLPNYCDLIEIADNKIMKPASYAPNRGSQFA